mmetsp:Transcript_40878/g.46448  ORF Transcript_40878/g.46448 Transcript_40878/m.46448 type:complete len:98 (-) Transcript_40878:59-352(-)
MTDLSFLSAIENSVAFNFPKRRKPRGVPIRSIAARQFVLRTTGSMFVRLIVDEQDWVILVVILNSRLIREKHSIADFTHKKTRALRNFMSSITQKSE